MTVIAYRARYSYTETVSDTVYATDANGDLVPTTTNRVITQSVDEYISDFSQAKLSAYEAAGCVAIAESDDGTEAEVAWSTVSDPGQAAASAHNTGSAFLAVESYGGLSTQSSDDGLTIYSPSGNPMLVIFDDHVRVLGDLYVDGTVN